MLCFNMSYRKYWKRNTSNKLISSGNDAPHAPILENLASRRMLPTAASGMIFSNICLATRVPTVMMGCTSF